MDILCPFFDFATPAKVTVQPDGKVRMRKQVLKNGTLNYEGAPINFSPKMYGEIVDSFKRKALDQTAFLLADKTNAHTMDPERFRGEIVSMEATGDALFADVEFASTEAANAVLSNPNLGVSARLRPPHERGDGQKFGTTMVHLLGTLDPKVTGLQAWESIPAVNLSTETDVVNMTGISFTEGTTMDPIVAALLKQFDELDEAKTAELLAELAKADETTEPGKVTEPTKVEDGKVTEPAKTAEPAKELIGAGAALSVEAKAEIDLANANTGRALKLLAEQRATTERATWASKLPPAVLDLAMPMLNDTETDGASIDLANGTKTTVPAQVRALLTQVSGLIDLSTVPKGHGTVVTPAAANKEAIDKLAAQFNVG